MASEEAPAYQWFVKDWRSSRAGQRMTFAERGVYREMLDEQWERRTLPDDPDAVAELIATTEAQRADVLAAWPVVRRKFVTVEGGQIQNARLERCRREFRAFLREKRKGGKARAAGAQRDAGGTFQATSTPPATSQQTSSSRPADIQPASASSSASATASAKREETRAFPPMNGTTDPELADRAGAFCERYSELYPLHRRGARYLPKPALDYTKACELCAVWDNDRLERLAVVFLKCEEPFAQSGSRTIGQFAAMASWCDDRLREVESAA